jgi:hypothetical protein
LLLLPLLLPLIVPPQTLSYQASMPNNLFPVHTLSWGRF